MIRLVTVATVSTLAISAALALTPASAQAHPISVTCGATITTDTKLTSDLLNCPDNGIVIGADDITLDLNGHTLRGDGAPVGSCPSGAVCDVGIDGTAGHNRVTIRGGTVRRFNIAVFAVGGSQNRIQRISSANNSLFGMIVGDSTQSRVDHNSSVHDGISGIVLFDSSHMRVDHNSITGTTGYAVPVLGSSHNRFEDNLLTNDRHGFSVGSSNRNAGSNDNEIRGNRLSHGPSIEISHSSGNEVRNNSLTNPRDGILLIESQRSQVSDNSVTEAGVGLPDAGGFGIFLDGADDNLVQRNTVTGGRGPAIFVTSLESLQTSDRNTVTHNVVNSRLDSGILVNNNASATLVEHNSANGSHDDGIHIDAAGTTVTRNTANHNLNLGIEAVPDAIDGGGNKANEPSSAALAARHDSTTSAISTSKGDGALHFVELGDSWIAGEHCACTTFAGLWAADIAEDTGHAVKVTDLTGANERSAPQEKTTGSLLWTLRNEERTRAAIRAADIVLISTGGNDLQFIGDKIINGTCGGPDGFKCIRWLGRLWHRNFDQIVKVIRNLRGSRPTAIRLVAEGNFFLGSADLNSLVPKNFALTGGALMARLYVKANCDAAKEYDAKCIDGRPILSGPHMNRRFDENAPSTWRKLADALEDVGLPELCLESH